MDDAAQAFLKSKIMDNIHKYFSLLVSFNGLSGSSSSLSHVSSKANDVEVLVDVVHDLALEEGLGSIIHDLIAELGLSNVLSELLDSSASSLLGAIQVNDLVSIVLCSSTIIEGGHKLLDNLKLSSEQGILGSIHDIPVSLEEAGIDSWDSLNKSFKGGRDLELLEEAGHDTSSGGSGKTNLVIDNDGGVDGSSNKLLTDDVIVCLQWRSRVADWDSPVDESWELLLEPLNDLAQALELLDLNLRLLLVDINNLEFASIGALPALTLSKESSLLGLDDVPGNSSKLSILSNLVGRAGTDGVAVDIDSGLLTEVEPDDGAILGVDGAADLLKGLLEALNGWLSTAVDLESGDTAKVWNSGDGIGKFLYFVEMIGHTDRLLHGFPHGGGLCVSSLELV